MDISFLERLFDRLLDFWESCSTWYPSTGGAAFSTCLSNKLFIFDNSILKRKFKTIEYSKRFFVFPSQQNFFENGGFFLGGGKFSAVLGGLSDSDFFLKNQNQQVLWYWMFKKKWSFRVFKNLNNRTQHWVFFFLPYRQGETFAVEEKKNCIAILTPIS